MSEFWTGERGPLEIRLVTAYAIRRCEAEPFRG